MIANRSQSGRFQNFRRIRAIRNVSLAIVAGLLLFITPILFFSFKNTGRNERIAIQELWESSEFERTYLESRELLRQNPMDYFLLTVRGFSAYQLAVAQINAFDTLFFIDDCISALRKALLLPESESDGRIYYVLGKAYYDKGAGYADLAVQYLEKCLNLNYDARDIPQYLGLSYAAIRDYKNSVAAFSLALESAEGNLSDSLLIAVANSYRAMGELDSAQTYLSRCIETSLDAKTKATARIILGGVMAERGNLSGAEAQYKMILEENGENADAHFQLGEIYAAGGDPTRARAEWRTAVRVDPAHRLARARLNG